MGHDHIDLDTIGSLIALQSLPDNVAEVREVRGRKLDEVYLGNCANGTMTDLRQAASILKGQKVHPDTRMIVVPASQKVWLQASREGLLDIFAKAGAAVSMPTCGACFGGHNGVMGQASARSRPPTATSRDAWGRRRLRSTPRTPMSPPPPRSPARSWNRMRPLRCNRPHDAPYREAIVIKDDNVDTDALYPGKYLNVIDSVQAKSHLFEGLDPKLRELLTEGDTVLFVGENFGCGNQLRC